MKLANQRVASYLEPFGNGFAIGGVPTVAHINPPHCLLDTSLQRHGEIWAAAGTPESVFRMTPAQLEQITSGTWHDLALD